MNGGENKMDFTKINQLLSDLNKNRPLNADELNRLKEEFIIDFTYNSNAIEGNTLTLQETALILNEGVTIGEKPLKDHLEAVGHKEAYDYIEELVKEKASLSENAVKSIHHIVLLDKPDSKGVYRNVPVRIMGSAYTPPQPWEVPIQMERLIEEYNILNNAHIIEKVSLLHLKFERIHPFIDGNGRTGRLLLNMELMKAGYPPINVKFKDRRKYYECFEAYEYTKEPTQMIELIAGYTAETLERYLAIANAKNIQTKKENTPNL